MAEDPRIEQIREVLANHTDPFSIYGHQGRGLERIRAIVGSVSPVSESCVAGGCNQGRCGGISDPAGPCGGCCGCLSGCLDARAEREES